MTAKDTILQSGFADGATTAINDIRDMCHDLAQESGWWTDQETGLPLLEAAGRWAPHVIAGKIALIHSEASEALKGHRKI